MRKCLSVSVTGRKNYEIHRMFAVGLAFFAVPAAAQDSSAIAECGLYAYSAKITEVYDGDTVTADVDLGFKVWRKDEKLRLHGIDAPEVRGKERSAGLRSRDALRKRVLGRDVIVCTFKDKTGKYGRYLADIFLDGENINDWLINQGLAEIYEPAKSASAAAFSLPGKRFVRAALPTPDSNLVQSK